MKLLTAKHDKTVLELVGRVQTLKRGESFHSLSPRISKRMVHLDPAPYQPENPRSLLPMGDPGDGGFFFWNDSLPDQFEHFLQYVRESFLGVPFQFLLVCLGDCTLKVTEIVRGPGPKPLK